MADEGGGGRSSAAGRGRVTRRGAAPAEEPAKMAVDEQGPSIWKQEIDDINTGVGQLDRGAPRSERAAAHARTPSAAAASRIHPKLRPPRAKPPHDAHR